MPLLALALGALQSDAVPPARAVKSAVVVLVLLAPAPGGAQRESWMARARQPREASADASVAQLAPPQDAVASTEHSARLELQASQRRAARPDAAPLAVPTWARPAEVEAQAVLQVGQPWATLAQEARMAPAPDFHLWPERPMEMQADAAGKSASPAPQALKERRKAPQNSVELETRLTVVVVEPGQPAAAAPREARREPQLVAARVLAAEPPEME